MGGGSRRSPRRGRQPVAATAPAARQAPTSSCAGEAPVVIASANGDQLRNGGPRTCVEEAWRRIARGEDVLDALVAGVNIVELDPAETSVGYGGLPNAEGVVQLDSCCMHGPRSAGGRRRLPRGRAHAVARRQGRARPHRPPPAGRARGRRPSRASWASRSRPDLNTENSRAKWLEWKRRIDPEHYLGPAQRAEAGEAAARRRWWREGLLDARAPLRHDQLRRGRAEGRALRGHDHERPRVQDPGPGGRLADPRGRALGRRRGRRRGLDRARRGEPLQPLVLPDRRGDAARRLAEGRGARGAPARRRPARGEKRLLDAHGNPAFQLTFYVLDKKGATPGVSLYAKVAAARGPFRGLHARSGPEILPCDSLLGEATAGDA